MMDRNKIRWVIVIGILALALAIMANPGHGFEYSMDVSGTGSGSSYTSFDGIGDSSYWSDSEVVIGHQIKVSDSRRSMFSGFKLDGMDGRYTSFGDIGVLHSIAASDITKATITSSFVWNENPMLDTVDKITSYNVSGTSAVSANVTGSLSEDVTGVDEKGRPLDLSRFSADGTVVLTSKVVY